MASRRLLIATLYLTLAVAITASVFAIWPVVADAPWEDKVPVQPTPAGRPTRTALEVSQAVQTQIPDWCTNSFNQTSASAPRWEESSKVWNLGCSIFPALLGGSVQLVTCYEIDDTTLEITLTVDAALNLSGPWDC